MKSVFDKPPDTSFIDIDMLEHDVRDFDHLLKLCLFQKTNGISIHYHWKDNDGVFTYSENISEYIWLDNYEYHFINYGAGGSVEVLSRNGFENGDYKVTYTTVVDFSKSLIKNIELSSDSVYLISPRVLELELRGICDTTPYYVSPSDILIITNVNSAHTQVTALAANGNSYALNQKDIIDYWDIHHEYK